MNSLLKRFSLEGEKEDLNTVISDISKGVIFRGTNLWVLIFAVFVASLGLNVNSTAVIIGAMLISPIMGPIMGIGLGIGIIDTVLIRKALSNYLTATLVALATSTVFFLISPLNDVHSEILARTSPTIYDVLIAMFGGFAGIVATSSKYKGNVIPGVAIATALMPPLCTAGYGLATLRFDFFFGAFYLFVINTVFIALATFIIVRSFHFPAKHFQSQRAEKIAQLIIWIVVIITLTPSVYFGYEKVQQNKYIKNAENFISFEADFPNDYLLSKKIDARERKMVLVFGGKEISEKEIAELRLALNKYDLQDTKLEIKQGFSYLSTDNVDNDEKATQLGIALSKQEEINKQLQKAIDSINSDELQCEQLFNEIKAQYPVITSGIIKPTRIYTDSTSENNTLLISLFASRDFLPKEKQQMNNWLTVRLNKRSYKLFIQ